MQTNEIEISLEDCKKYYKFALTIPEIKKENFKAIKFFIIFMAITMPLFYGFDFFKKVHYVQETYHLTFSEILQIPQVTTYLLTLILTVVAFMLIGSILLFFIIKYDPFSFRAKQLFKIIKDRSSKKTIYLTENGIRCLSDKADSVFNWEKIYNVYKTQEYIYIFIGKLTGIIVPLRAFNSEEDANSFYEEIKSHINTEN